MRLNLLRDFSVSPLSNCFCFYDLFCGTPSNIGKPFLMPIKLYPLIHTHTHTHTHKHADTRSHAHKNSLWLLHCTLFVVFIISDG